MELFKKSKDETLKMFDSSTDNFRVLLLTFKRFENNIQKDRSVWSKGYSRFPQTRLKLFFKVIIRICINARVHHSTFSLAVKLFDSLIVRRVVEDENISSVGIICLVIATKVREPFQRFLRIKDLSELLEVDDLTNLTNLEKKILKQLDFAVNLVLPFDIFLLLSHLCSVQESRSNKSVQFSKTDSLVSRLFYLSTKHHQFNEFSPLVVGASILVVSRLVRKCNSPWPNRLAKLTGLTVSDFVQCIELLKSSFGTIQIKGSLVSDMD